MPTIINLLDESGIDYKLPGQHKHATKGWVNIDCIKCSPDSGKYLYGINTYSLIGNCWACGRDSPSTSASLGYLGIGGAEIRGLLRSKGQKGQNIALNAPNRRRGNVAALPPGVGPMGKAHRQYLRQRGFDPREIADVWQVQGIGLTTNYRWRLFIPVYFNDKLVSWTTRSVVPTEPKRYLNARPEDEVISIKDTLYGYDFVGNSAVILEGPTDAWAVGPGSLCTWGLSLTSTQIALIANIPRRVICFDNAPAAQKAAQNLCRELKLFPGETINVCLESGDDPATADYSEIKQLRKYLC